MASLVHIVQQTLADFADQPIILAYSGGIDSQVLLEILSQLKQQKKLSNHLIICHVNHGLSNNAAQWQIFAQQQCKQRNLTLVTKKVEITRKKQQSLEQLAREARYQALDEQAEKLVNAVVLTGHHQDDQAETFLLALKRGSGLKGLSAMPKISRRKNFTLVRPLLTVSRDEIEYFAQQHNLVWVEDESNEDQVYDRNYLRHNILPQLTERWPAIKTTINRSSEHCQEAQNLLDDLASLDLVVCLLPNSPSALSISALKQLSVARFNNLLRYFLASHGKLMPTSEQLKQLHQQIGAKHDKNPAIKLADTWLRRYQDGLYLTENFADVSNFLAPLDLTSLTTTNALVVTLPDNVGQVIIEKSKHHSVNNSENTPLIKKSLLDKALFVSAPRIQQRVEIRFSHCNPHCLPDYRQHHRPLKKVLQELNIPPWQRKRIAYLYYDDELVAALGYFVCKAYRVETADEILKVTLASVPQ
jgi:tRNA(Ile)-lysidine synthase